VNDLIAIRGRAGTNMSESRHDGPRGKWQFSLFALMAAVTAFAFFLSMMKSVPSELWVGVGMVVAVAVGIGIAYYETYRKPPP
jgi:heme/copper-type cytochrome/quinol oxidase subunit 4